MSGAGLNDCGCCEGLASETPARVFNRDGLRAIAYRCGTHRQFKESMLAALSSSRHPALGELKTRDDDDFSIALLDAWAVVADVLSFYQERYAQESYLGTATERRSLLELARLLGYELRPGVAAGTHLAFTLEDVPGSPKQVTLAPGTKVQSVPGLGEKPQTFETVEKFEARAEWNAIKAQASRAQQITGGTQTIYLKGTATNLKKGDALLFIEPGLTASTSWAFVRVEKVTIESSADRTWVVLERAPSSFAPKAPGKVEVYALRQRAAMFGYNAPDPRVLAAKTRAFFGLAAGDTEWTFTAKTDSIDLDAAYPAILAESWMVLLKPSRFPGEVLSIPGGVIVTQPDPFILALCRITAVAEVGRQDYGLTSKVTRASAQKIASPDSPALSALGGDNLRHITVFAQSEKLEFAEAPVATPVTGNTVTLTGKHPDLGAGQFVAVSGQEIVTEKPVSKLVRIESIQRDDDSTTVTFSPPLEEKLEVKTVLPTELQKTVTVNANVVRATHGESVEEILGSGDASRAYQRFTLRQPPLTYVRGAGASGAVSTLAIRVNDLLWHEVPTLFGRGPRDRVFITRTDDDGRTVVQSGDGLTGARLPAGQENVRATYRRGLGREGNVEAGQLSTLLTRPLGLKGATNPAPATGGDDPETLDGARGNAPLTVLTLDRVVSLRDYQDFARAYAGITKALATWTWDGRQRGIFITVAGVDGAEFSYEAELVAAIRAAGDPFVPVQVRSYQPKAALFKLRAMVKVDPDYEADKVLAAVEAALRRAFSFEAREFGQPVHLSEVIAVMQAVAGVLAIDVNELSRGGPPGDRLLAAVPKAGEPGVLAPAELLTLNPGPLEQLALMP